MVKSRSYQDGLVETLKDPDEAVTYLNAALEDGDQQVFLVALQNVAEAFGNMAKLAKAAHLNRESLYQMLSLDKENPRISNFDALLHAMDFKLGGRAFGAGGEKIVRR